MTSQLEPIEFADRSIRDADRDLAWNVVPNEVDCEGATPQDSLNCAVARAVDRILGNMGKPCKAVVGKSVVLIYYADEGVRYMLDANSRALIDHFDKWGSFPPKARIKLLAPRVGQSGWVIASRAQRSVEGEGHTRRATLITCIDRQHDTFSCREGGRDEPSHLQPDSGLSV